MGGDRDRCRAAGQRFDQRQIGGIGIDGIARRIGPLPAHDTDRRAAVAQPDRVGLTALPTGGQDDAGIGKVGQQPFDRRQRLVRILRAMGVEHQRQAGLARNLRQFTQADRIETQRRRLHRQAEVKAARPLCHPRIGGHDRRGITPRSFEIADRGGGAGARLLPGDRHGMGGVGCRNDPAQRTGQGITRVPQQAPGRPAPHRRNSRCRDQTIASAAKAAAPRRL